MPSGCRNLRYLQAPAINNTTVFDDFAVDQLTGGAGTDWFVYFSTDRPLDAAAGEEGLGMPL
jgi:hypothetical protein